MLGRLGESIGGGRFGAAEVTAVTHLTPHMVRVTLAGDLVRDFPDDSGGGHFKMLVPERHQSAGQFASFVETGQFKSELRTYTLRHVRPSIGEIDVDIVVHRERGRVGPWAQRARRGDQILISKCGQPKLITQGAKRILAAVDMAGFPALAAGLETVGSDVCVSAFVDVASDADHQPINAPPSCEIEWIVNSDPSAPGADLIHAVTAASRPDAETSVFVAGEFSMVAALRKYFQVDLRVDKAMRYVSSYWKAGLEEPEHQIAKRAAA